MHYEERIGGGGLGFTASPVAGGGHLYFTGEQGDVFVIPATNKFSVVATNQLDGLCLATPAISEIETPWEPLPEAVPCANFVNGPVESDATNRLRLASEPDMSRLDATTDASRGWIQRLATRRGLPS
jgi:hypothetical protein